MSLFSGRMRRRTFGLLMIAYFIASWGLAWAGGISQLMTDVSNGRPPNFDMLYQPRWLFAAISVLMVVAFTVVLVRRLNDLEWSPWIGYIYGLITLGTTIYTYARFNEVMRGSANPGQMGGFNMAISAFGLIAFIFFIVLVFKRGTVGPNSNGPDPSV